MNPNNNNVEYLLGLPTPRLLNLYRKVRGQLCAFNEYDWDWYKLRREELQEHIDKEPPRYVRDSQGAMRWNPLYRAWEIKKMEGLAEAIKEELDHREHVARKTNRGRGK